MRAAWPILALLVACATEASEPVTTDPNETEDPPGSPPGEEPPPKELVPQVSCAGEPDAGPTEKFHHFSSKAIAFLGSPKHRGLDLVAAASATEQTLAGAASYTVADKALEDEDVDVFACRAGEWKKVGRARTDGEGFFKLVLRGGDRMPIGLRDMFVSVVGDRTGARFVAFVAPDGASLIASDVDGTLTSSENAFFDTIVTGADADVRAGASAALDVAKTRGYQMVYVTARGQQYTEASRGWFERKSFPRGPLRLSPSFLTLPGGDTVDFKTAALRGLTDAGFVLAAGIGNRASDIQAYAAAGLAPDRTFIESTEFASEVQPEIAAGKAIGFSSYDDLKNQQLSQLPQL